MAVVHKVCAGGERMKAYKGFDKDLKCRGFQYEVGKEYETDKAKACEYGFHACENPLDVFKYFAPANSRYCEVEQSGTLDKHNEDSKVASTKIRIVREIGLKGIIEAGVKFILDRVNRKDTKESNTGDYSAATNTGFRSLATNTGNYSAATNTGYRSSATNTGDCSAATNIGDYSVATNTGDCSAATNTGCRSAATNTGDCSAATNTGYYSAATNTGFRSLAANTGCRSAATNTGNYSAATNTGDYSAAMNTGDCSAAVVSGKESIAIATGYDGKAKGSIGCYIVLAEWYEDDDGNYHIKTVKANKVDGKTIKADTFYILRNGEFVEVDNDN